MGLRKLLLISSSIIFVVFSCGVEKTDKGTGTPDSTPPTQIADLAAGNPTDSSLVLTWTAPGDDDTSGTAAQYDIRFDFAMLTDSTWDSAIQPFSFPIPQAGGTPETLLVFGLAADTTYYFGIKTADEVPNWSAISNIATGRTDTGLTIPDFVPPAAITDLRVTDAGFTFIEISWTVPGDDSTVGAATAYDIRYSIGEITELNFTDAGQVTAPPTPLPPDSVQTYTFFDLDTNTTYYFAIKTADEVPNWSAISNIAVGATSADIIPPAPISDLRVVDTTETTATLVWTAPGDDDTLGHASFYDIRYSPRLINEVNFPDAQIAPNLPVPSPAGINDTITISGLESDTVYYFAVKTGDEMLNWSTISNVLTAKTESVDRIPPAPITDLEIIDSSLTSLTLSWTALGDDGNLGTASSYDFRISQRSITDWDCPFGCDPWYYDNICEQDYWCVPPIANELIPSVSGTRDTIIILGLTPLRRYYIRMKASDNYNWSFASNQVCGTTMSSQDTVPPAPITNLGAVTIRSTSLTLLWTAAGDDGTLGQTTEYDIRYTIGSDISEATWESATRIQDIGPPQPSRRADSIIIDNLLPTTAYSFAVKSIDDEGLASEISNVANVTTSSTDETWQIARRTGVANSVKATDDGGFVFVVSAGMGYCMKMDAEGTNIEWYKSVGGLGGGDLQSLAIDPSGGIVIAGNRTKCDEFYYCEDDIYLGYLTPSGETIWDQYYSLHKCQIASSVSYTSDGGYVIAGSPYHCGTAFLTRTDGTGNKVWGEMLTGMNQCYDVLTIESGFLLAGNANGSACVMKINTTGAVEWTGSHGGENNDVFHTIVRLNENEYLLAGYTESFDAGLKDVYLVWVDSLGNELEGKTIGGGGDDIAYDMIPTSDGNFVLVGSTTSFGSGGFDVYLIKISPLGSVLWERAIGGLNDDEARSVAETTDGGLIVVGRTASYGIPGYDSIVYIIKTDANGEL